MNGASPPAGVKVTLATATWTGTNGAINGVIVDPQPGSIRISNIIIIRISPIVIIPVIPTSRSTQTTIIPDVTCNIAGTNIIHKKQASRNRSRTDEAVMIERVRRRIIHIHPKAVQFETVLAQNIQSSSARNIAKTFDPLNKLRVTLFKLVSEPIKSTPSSAPTKLF